MVSLDGNSLTLQQYHDNGDPGITEKGRDLNRFRCELNAYKNLASLGVCEKGLVPRCYGYIDQLDPKEYRPYFDHFLHDLYNPKAIIFEYLPNAESLNCVNYSKQRFQMVIDGLKEIHKAFIHHHDIYPRNMLLVPGSPERMLWVDFDVAITFPNRDAMSRKDDEYSLYEEILVEDLGELLVWLSRIQSLVQDGTNISSARGSRAGASA